MLIINPGAGLDPDLTEITDRDLAVQRSLREGITEPTISRHEEPDAAD